MGRKELSKKLKSEMQCYSCKILKYPFHIKYLCGCDCHIKINNRREGCKLKKQNQNFPFYPMILGLFYLLSILFAIITIILIIITIFQAIQIQKELRILNIINIANEACINEGYQYATIVDEHSYQCCHKDNSKNIQEYKRSCLKTIFT